MEINTAMRGHANVRRNGCDGFLRKKWVCGVV